MHGHPALKISRPIRPQGGDQACLREAGLWQTGEENYQLGVLILRYYRLSSGRFTTGKPFSWWQMVTQ